MDTTAWHSSFSLTTTNTALKMVYEFLIDVSGHQLQIGCVHYSTKHPTVPILNDNL